MINKLTENVEFINCLSHVFSNVGPVVLNISGFLDCWRFFWTKHLRENVRAVFIIFWLFLHFIDQSIN